MIFSEEFQSPIRFDLLLSIKCCIRDSGALGVLEVATKNFPRDFLLKLSSLGTW